MALLIAVAIVAYVMSWFATLSEEGIYDYEDRRFWIDLLIILWPVGLTWICGMILYEQIIKDKVQRKIYWHAIRRYFGR